MHIGVVHLLKMIQIDHHDTEGFPGLIKSVFKLPDSGLEETLGIEGGQIVGSRQIVEAGICKRHGNVLDQIGQQFFLGMGKTFRPSARRWVTVLEIS